MNLLNSFIAGFMKIAGRPEHRRPKPSDLSQSDLRKLVARWREREDTEPVEKSAGGRVRGQR